MRAPCEALLIACSSAIRSTDAGAERIFCSCSTGGAVQRERQPGRQLLSAARMLALQQTERLEALSEQGGYLESLLQEDAELQNEHYTDRYPFCHLVCPWRHLKLSMFFFFFFGDKGVRCGCDSLPDQMISKLQNLQSLNAYDVVKWCSPLA